MIDLSGPVGAFLSAAIVASLGTWWFAFVLKGLKDISSSQRLIVYGSIWLAYFVLMMILIDRLAA